MTPLRVVVYGEVSTAHRPRYSGTTKRGKPIMRSDEGFRDWKARCARAASEARVEWERLNGPWATEGVRYAVRCLALLSADRKDADSVGRGFLDGCEGVLWRNDRACRPVILDCETTTGRPRIVVDVIPYDPESELISVEIRWHGDG